MKAMKKVFTTLLAVIMVMSLSVTAFAEGKTGSITVKNAGSTATYTAYKIFDVTYSGTNYSYSISKDSAWLTVVQNYIVQEGDEGITLTKSADGNDYVVTTDKDVFSAADFAEYLYKNVPTTETGTALSYDSETETASISGLELGYYFVTSSVGSLANLTTTNPSVIIYDKNEQPPFDKTVDDADVEIGQTVTYTITGKVPSTTGYTTYTYKVSDTLSKGLTFNKDVKVTFGKTEITLSSTELVYNTTDDGFILTFDMTNYQAYVDQEIIITYSAVVNENAVVMEEGNPNNANLVYSNNPNDTTSTATETDKEKVYTVDLTIDKYAANKDDDNDTSTKLSGAGFILVKKDAEDKETYYQAVYAYTYTEDEETKTVYSADGKTYYSDKELKTEVTLDGSAELTKGKVVDVNWVSDKSKATVAVTDKMGAAEFEGIEAGLVEDENDTGATYYLREITAPEGYNLLTKDVEVGIKRTETTGTDGTVTVAITGDEVGVANETGAELPSTGGIGTTIFYVVGTILVLGAAILLITRKRMSGTQE